MKNIHKYGNELQIIGMVVGNGRESQIIIIPGEDFPPSPSLVDRWNASHEEWKEIIDQMDTLGIEGPQKVILRKSQRQIQQQVQWNVFRRDSYRCVYCLKNHVPLIVDHVVLWEKGGDSVEGNLLSSCRKCNKTRGSMDFLDWFKSDWFGNLPGGKNQLNLDFLASFYNDAVKLPLRKNMNRSRY